MAARWFHLATLAPYTEAPRAAVEADHALSRALTVLEPGARRVSGEGFTGWLRGPSDAPGTVVVVPGLDSAKEEFLDLVSALLARGLAVFAMDAPDRAFSPPPQPSCRTTSGSWGGSSTPSAPHASGSSV